MNPIKLLVFACGLGVLAGAFVAQDNPGQAAAGAGNFVSSLFGSSDARLRANASVPTPARGAPAATPTAVGFGAIVIPSDASGHFNTRVDVQGVSIPVLVDTGATFLTLSNEDADKLGLRPMPSEFTIRLNTANGEIKAAKTVITEVRLENMIVMNVETLVLPPGVLSRSLLGMSFLRKVGGYEVAGGQFVIKP